MEIPVCPDCGGSRWELVENYAGGETRLTTTSRSSSATSTPPPRTTRSPIGPLRTSNCGCGRTTVRPREVAPSGEAAGDDVPITTVNPE